MRLVGQFRDLEDPNRFVWIRRFPGMGVREPALGAFYSGPVWQAHRGEANPLLDDNDNVLLLRPSAPGRDFAAPGSPRPPKGAAPAAAGLVVATVYHLWKEPADGFAAFFEAELRPALEAAGLPVLGAFVPERAANNFPPLPVREGEKVFVWFTRVSDQAAHDAALARLEKQAAGPGSVQARLREQLERQPQVLRLAPTPRSRLR